MGTRRSSAGSEMLCIQLRVTSFGRMIRARFPSYARAFSVPARRDVIARTGAPSKAITFFNRSDVSVSAANTNILPSTTGTPIRRSALARASVSVTSGAKGIANVTTHQVGWVLSRLCIRELKHLKVLRHSDVRKPDTPLPIEHRDISLA